MKKYFSLIKSEDGASMLEYLLLGLCILVVALAGIANMGESLADKWEHVGSEFGKAMGE